MSNTKAALVVAFLCVLTYFIPWVDMVSDPFWVHVYSIFPSLCIVTACYLISRSWPVIMVQVIECICIVYQAKIIMNWNNPYDQFYIYHDQFMELAFALEMVFILGSFNKVSAVLNGLSDTLRRTFLAFVSLYPSQHRGIYTADHKEHFKC